MHDKINKNILHQNHSYGLTILSILSKQMLGFYQKIVNILLINYMTENFPQKMLFYFFLLFNFFYHYHSYYNLV